jgi:hypothetical protein
MPSTHVPSLWEPYGLRSSPFFQTELRPADPSYPVSLFVGREAESLRIRRRIASDPATRTLVQGDPGVGKTSFVNWVKAELAATGIATYEHPIRISSDTTRLSFIADALRTLLRIRSSAEPRRARKEHDEFWERTGRMLQGGELTGGSLSLAGFGAGVSRGYIAPQVREDSLFEHLGEALRLLTLEADTSVLLHVNNLENVQDPAATAVLIRDLRDYLLLDGAHWIFVGALGIEDGIFRVYDQVSGIFPAAETLEPLAPAQIQRLLELRYRHLRIKGRELTAPVEAAAAARLYALYQGDLRNFLRLLGDAADRALGLHGIEPMTEVVVLRQMAPQYERWLRRQVGETDFNHLTRIAAERSGTDPEFRVTDAAGALGVSQAAASQLVERLLRERVIRQTRTQGRSVFYRPIGGALVALGVPPDVLLAGAPR